MGVRMVGPVNSGAAVGANGSATANQNSTAIVTGEVLAVMVKYNGAKPATTDVVIATAGNRHPAQTLLTLTNNVTDVTKLPRVQVTDATGAALTFDGTHPIVAPMPIDDQVNVNIAQGNAGDSVDVWLLVKDR